MPLIVGTDSDNHYGALLLFDFSLLENDAAAHNRIKLDELEFVGRARDVFGGRVEISRPRRAVQFDGDALLALLGHLQHPGRIHDDDDDSVFVCMPAGRRRWTGEAPIKENYSCAIELLGYAFFLFSPLEQWLHTTVRIGSST